MSRLSVAFAGWVLLFQFTLCFSISFFFRLTRSVHRREREYMSLGRNRIGPYPIFHIPIVQWMDGGSVFMLHSQLSFLGRSEEELLFKWRVRVAETRKFFPFDFDLDPSTCSTQHVSFPSFFFFLRNLVFCPCGFGVEKKKQKVELY